MIRHLKQKISHAISEERFEEAAILRDVIKQSYKEIESRISVYKEHLRQSIQAEQFEVAAILRDQIKDLRSCSDPEEYKKIKRMLATLRAELEEALRINSQKRSAELEVKIRQVEQRCEAAGVDSHRDFANFNTSGNKSPEPGNNSGGGGGDGGGGGVTSDDGRPLLAVCSTMQRPDAETLADWAAYHVAVGFRVLLLFLDDPDDAASGPAAADAARAGGGEVVVVRRDSDLEARWRRRPEFARLGDKAETDHMARQMLNAGVALDMARELGVAWLLHIDADELFYHPQLHVHEHFAGLSSFGGGRLEQAVYLNLEALPASARPPPGTPFRHFTRFKRNPHVLVAEESQRLVSEWVASKVHYFTGYQVGKAAVRPLQNASVEDVTLFKTPGGLPSFSVWEGPYVLHYAVLDLPSLRRKAQFYAGLGGDTLNGLSFVRFALEAFAPDKPDHAAEEHFRQVFLLDTPARLGKTKKASATDDSSNTPSVSATTLKALLVTVPGPAALLALLRPANTTSPGSADERIGGCDPDACLNRTLAPRKRRWPAAEPLDVDSRGCMLPLCDAGDAEGLGRWVRPEGAVCKRSGIICFTRRECCALVDSSTGRSTPRR